jgi:hypothetical protein
MAAPASVAAATNAAAMASELEAALRAAFDGRVELCAIGCKGWFLDSDTCLPNLCDECAALNGYAGILSDSMLLMLAEVWTATLDPDAHFGLDDDMARSK